MTARNVVPGWIGLVVAALAAAAMAGLVTSMVLGGTGGEPRPGAGNASLRAAVASAVEPVAGGEAGPTQAPKPTVPGQPLRLQIPSVGIDTVVGRMLVVPGGVVNPPTGGSAYWLSGYGTAGPASNTVYIAGHTCRGKCSAVFSPLLDIPRSATTVHPGEKVFVGTPEGEYSYTITDTKLYEKVAVQQESELWKVVPGRLVLVTCFQYNGGTSSQQNFVVYATLDG